MSIRPWRALVLLALATVAVGALGGEPLDRIVVAADDNYPPYVFRDADGELKGYLVDAWALWSQKTGVAAEIRASGWADAQARFARGEADVLEMVLRTPEREREMDFSPPYAEVPVGIYVHRSIQGIDGAKTLRAFAVGVKRGDACIGRLAAAGVDRIEVRDSNQDLVDAARAGDVRVFCLAEPAAEFLLARSGADNDFRRAFTFYRGALHRAVGRGREGLLVSLDAGFAALSEAETEALRDKWMGRELMVSAYGAAAIYGLAGLGVLILGVGAWNFVLRRRVAQRTRELVAEREHLNAILDGVGGYIYIKDLDLRYRFANRAVCELFGRPLGEVVGRADAEFFDAATAEALRANDLRVIGSGERLVVVEENVIRAIGEGRSYLSVKQPMRDADGRVVGLLGISTDISERRRVELALKESEARLRALFEHAGVGVAEVETGSGRVLRINQRYCELLGCTPDEVRDLDLVGITHPDDLPAYREHLARLGAGSIDGFSLELRCCRRNADPVWMSLVVTALAGEAAGPRRHIVVAEDIDARKQAIARADAARIETEGLLAEAQQVRRALLSVLEDERAAQAALRESEQRFRRAVEEAPFPIMIHADDGEVLALSRTWTDLTGYGRDQITNLDAWTELAYGADGGAVRALIDETYELQQRKAEGEFTVRCRDGSRRVWEFSSVALGRLGDGRRTAISMAADVTQRQRAEAQLRKLAQAVEQSPGSVVITDLDAGMEYVNEAFLRVTGYGREELLGRNPRMLQSGRTPAATYASLWQAIRGGQSWKGEFFNRRKDGSEYVEFAIVSPIRQDDGRITHYVAVKEDISEKKRLAQELDRHRNHLEEQVALRTEELRAAKDAAERATRAKSAFLANMSHEIRTPMNAIIGLTHLLRASATEPEQRERLDKIGSAGQHLLSIINDILDLSKIEAGRLRMEIADFSIADVVDSVASIIAESARAKGLRVEVDAGEAPAWLRGDATRLRQALLNYAGNAVKFTDTGHITLRARILQEMGDDLLLRFEVQDSGIGIDPAQIPRLFEAFEQIDASATRRHGGTGLGLAIARRLARLMGGEAGAESAPGQGSTFWFTARLGRGQSTVHAAKVSGGDAAAELRARHSGARVLLAEDNAINREVALALLHGVGLSVDVAEDGQAAVEQALAKPHDLILMDMQMPRMDGIAATRAIRARPQFARLPILAMTANAFGEDREACLGAGMNDHIAKPVDPQAFYAILLRHLDAALPGAVPAPAPGSAPAEETATLQARIEAIPGLVVARGLRFSAGRWPLYARLLGMLVRDHGDDMPRLRERLAAGDIETAARMAHSLKGAGATLGAETLRERAAALETALNALPDGAAAVESLCLALGDELGRLVAAIRDLDGEVSGGASRD